MENYQILRALRLQAGESQKQCAVRMYVSTRTISGWESPTTCRLLPRHMKNIYRAYKVTEPEAIALAESYRHDSEVVKAAPAFLSGKRSYINTILGFDESGNPVLLLDVIDKVLGDERIDPSLGRAMLSSLKLILEERA